jgi:indole-3-glycerol phosphate synthase
MIVSESGIESPTHIRFLRKAGAQAFLVGTVVISANNMEKKVRELVEV